MNNTLTADTALQTQVDATVAALRAAYQKDIETPRRGRRTERTFAEVVSSIGWIRPMQAIFDANPVLGYLAAQQLRRELTPEEVLEIAESTEAQGQGLLPNNEPAQVELFNQTPIRVEGEDTDASAFINEVRRAVRAAQAVAQMERTTLYVRYMPNVVTRSKKSGGKNALRAKQGGRVYYSDRATHSGTILAVVTPNAGERTALGKVEWQTLGFAK